MKNILNAITFATAAHIGQKRKGKEVPYITHPLAVGLMLARIGAPEDVIIAGILHDTIEDTDVLLHEIEDIFGKNTAEMVNDVTEQDGSLPWAQRKKAALLHIPHMKEGSLLVKSADVLHNMTDQITDFEIEGDKMFERFNASKADQLDRYEKLVKALSLAMPDNPLLPTLKKTLTRLKELWT